TRLVVSPTENRKTEQRTEPHAGDLHHATGRDRNASSTYGAALVAHTQSTMANDPGPEIVEPAVVDGQGIARRVVAHHDRRVLDRVV
ncbi:hypothetical protein, partial [Micromonospora chersina]|uniref:hypothetical protein n=1 Tax=Micromonospora chersina TaxID=47854 RepID=UPI003719994D